MSPKKFLKTLRLNAARHELHRASGATTVTEVAFHWGFFHLARFAADYHQMFGELPSQTLRHAGA
jgi:AraC family ethanolamine operon transcriptional activator